MMRAVICSIVLALLFESTSAQAQDRGFVSISGGYRPASPKFSDTVRTTQNVEPGAIDTAYRVKAAPEFDVAGGVRLWRQLALAVDVAYLSKTAGGTVTAQVPHPLYFGRLRAVDRKSTRLNSSHVEISYAVFCLKKKNTNTTYSKHSTIARRTGPVTHWHASSGSVSPNRRRPSHTVSPATHTLSISCLPPFSLLG